MYEYGCLVRFPPILHFLEKSRKSIDINLKLRVSIPFQLYHERALNGEATVVNVSISSLARLKKRWQSSLVTQPSLAQLAGNLVQASND